MLILAPPKFWDTATCKLWMLACLAKDNLTYAKRYQITVFEPSHIEEDSVHHYNSCEFNISNQGVQWFFFQIQNIGWFRSNVWGILFQEFQHSLISNCPKRSTIFFCWNTIDITSCLPPKRYQGIFQYIYQTFSNQFKNLPTKKKHVLLPKICSPGVFFWKTKGLGAASRGHGFEGWAVWRFIKLKTFIFFWRVESGGPSWLIYFLGIQICFELSYFWEI